MQAPIEVIDVEAFHENLQRKSLDELKRKNKKLKDENQKLDTKINHLHRANDALSHKIFEQDQCRNELARLLGFESAEFAEASITSEDHRVPGGKAALSEARARILLLEDELAKHITAGKEAQAVITETKDQLEETHRYLDETLEDNGRLREERDLARQEAAKQAMEADKWRIEVQTTLPEMQLLIRKQQEDNKALLVSRLTTSTGNENITHGPLEHNPSPLCEVTNATRLPTVHSSPSSLVTANEAQRCKQQFELLEAQYEALRETKEKISKKFSEQLMKWKKFKHWLVKEEIQEGRKMAMKPRFSRRIKRMEEIGPQVVPHRVGFSDNVVSAAHNRGAGSPEVILMDPPNGGPVPDDNAKSDQKDFLAPPPHTPRFEESLTQPSTVPASLHSKSTGHTPAPRPSKIPQDPLKSGNDIPMSQQSLTQPSSMPSLSPVREPEDMLYPGTKEAARPKVFVIDSPPRDVNVVKQEEFVMKNEETPQQQHIASSSSAPETPIRIKTPRTSAIRLLQHQRLNIVQPISEPPPTNRLRHPSPANVQTIRRTSTVFVTDTPRRTSTSSIVRHHSSPPDSPHLQRMNKRKRKMEETGDGEESDPFKAGSSRVQASTFQTRDDKLARLKALTKKPHKAYMAEYMQFKGRGRYSNTNTSADKTVNGKFEIEPERNDGLDFQYDAVVRDKDERRRLEAVDCECCRDYYEAIGPLPPRLQAPLWKSPCSDITQPAARPCRYENNRIRSKTTMSSPSARMYTKAIEDHKHSISRHRHTWAPPKTPPDFWKIEFPDTPTVKDINRRADEMHAQKFQRVEAEANSINGRYRKRT